MKEVSQQPELLRDFGMAGDVTRGIAEVVTDSDSVTQVASLSRRTASLRGPGNGMR